MSKTLVVIRHAKSTWEYGPISDLDRPLKEVGISNTILVSKELKQLKVKPDLMMSSPAVRALSTALIVARELNYPSDAIKIEPGLYNESEEEVLEFVKVTDDAVNTLFIFGHNPAFTYLPNLFMKTLIDNLPTSGVVVLKFSTDVWADISKRNLESELCIFPKTLI